MIRYNQIKIEYSKLYDNLAGDITNDRAEKAYLLAIVVDELAADPDSIHSFRILKRSIDARRKPEIYYVYAVLFAYDDEERLLKKNKNNKNVMHIDKIPLYESRLRPIRKPDDGKEIVVIGAGPAGLFAAYALTLRGLRPILIERGAPMEERVETVERFWNEGRLNSESNVCFGEGGAGTFSDGKLNSGVKDKDGSKRFILETFVRYGAAKGVIYDALPHVGTDVLRSVVVNMRHDMMKFGCRFLFHTKLVGLDIRDGKLEGINIESTVGNNPYLDEFGSKYIETSDLVLAIGHSALDTYELLNEKGLEMIPKAFAVGVRVQHLQSDIDLAQYGDYAGDGQAYRLPAANYKLTGTTSDGRGVYSFCMCPGGYVVNSSSEHEGLVVNGMSDAARDSGYANGAIVVQVDPNTLKEQLSEEDGFYQAEEGSEIQDSEELKNDIFIGARYQRKLERAMYKVGDGQIPVQRYSDFKKTTDDVDKSVHGLSNNQPAVKGRWVYADVKSALPEDISQGVIDGIEQFGKKIKGFSDDDVLVIGVESRTSAPLRIVRDETMQSTTVRGVYPCGEGAGYAGGILSAAIDGLKVAQAICEK